MFTELSRADNAQGAPLGLGLGFDLSWSLCLLGWGLLSLGLLGLGLGFDLGLFEGKGQG